MIALHAMRQHMERHPCRLLPDVRRCETYASSDCLVRTCTMPSRRIGDRLPMTQEQERLA
jgi:hypothetical protein